MYVCPQLSAPLLLGVELSLHLFLSLPPLLPLFLPSLSLSLSFPFLALSPFSLFLPALSFSLLSHSLQEAAGSCGLDNAFGQDREVVSNIEYRKLLTELTGPWQSQAIVTRFDHLSHLPYINTFHMHHTTHTTHVPFTNNTCTYMRTSKQNGLLVIHAFKTLSVVSEAFNFSFFEILSNMWMHLRQKLRREIVRMLATSTLKYIHTYIHGN